MKASYKDITSKLGEPLWHDEVGCPRYELFHPSLLNNIYADQAVLMAISCQGCDAEFNVALSSGHFEIPLSQRIDDHSIHYGDPPNACCASGATMNSIPQRVMEFWHRPSAGEWVRDQAYERIIP